MSAAGRAIVSDPTWRILASTLTLSQRELQIVKAVFNDDKESAVAAELGISPHTVHTHLRRVYRKLGISSRVNLVVRVFAEYVALEARRASGPPSAATMAGVSPSEPTPGEVTRPPAAVACNPRA